MYLALETGDVLQGETASEGSAIGELVFNTAYTGYEEMLTDPSYNGQGLIFCYPLIGNYGVNPERFESSEVQPNFVVARQFTDEVRDWLDSEDVPAIEAVDTRALVRAVRRRGSMSAAVAPDKEMAVCRCEEAQSEGIDMVYHPNIESPPRVINEDPHLDADPTIALLDCGVKNAMIERLASRGARVLRFPWDVNSSALKTYDPDLLFVSNGPGNPAEYEKAINTVKSWHGSIPVAGICLGQQIIAHARGGDTRKMKFGHRGANQPVQELDSGRVKMTTQNHSYEVIEDSLPQGLRVTERNVNDNSVEGFSSDLIEARQYHPEANPGPNDSLDFFDRVIELTIS